MAKKIYFVAVALLAVFTVFGLPLKAEAMSFENWIVEPTLSYGSISYCQDCDLLNTYEFKQVTNPSDMGAKLNELISEFGSGDGNLSLCWGHGDGTMDYRYDEKKGLYGFYYTDEGGPQFIMRQRNDFFEQDSYYVNKLLAFKKIDSDEVKMIEGDYGTYYDFSDAETGDKYAAAYNGTFVTDFVYDDRDENTARDMIAVKFGDKWGVLGKDGNTLIPFEFEHITFINENAAFAKYNGEYGILNVFETTVK